MATKTQIDLGASKKPLVEITEMDHIVLRVADAERSLKFYTEVLGLSSERVDQWRKGDIRFPSVRINGDTIIDLFEFDQTPIGKDGDKNEDHFCLVIQKTDMEQLKESFEHIGVEIQAGPGKRWGSHGDGISLYVYDPDDNVVELRHY